MSSLQSDLQFSASFQHDQGQLTQFQSAMEYKFFSTPPSPDTLVPDHELLPDFHTPLFHTFSATPSPTFEESLHLPPSPCSEGTYEPPSSSTSKVPSRRSGNRVPRPRNAFMIFRSEFWAGDKISRTVEHDHRHISRIIGHCWNQLPESEKDKWRQKAEQEKLDHILKYPGYRFSPNVRTKKAVKRKVKRNSAEELLRCKQVADLLLAGKQGVELDSAVKSMKPPLATTVLQERNQESNIVEFSENSGTASPKSGELHRQWNSPTVENFESRDLSALDHIDIPIFRSPLLPPVESLSPTDGMPSVNSFLPSPALDSYESNGTTSQQFDMSSPPFHLPSAVSLQGSRQTPAYFDERPSFEGYSLNPGGPNAGLQQSGEQAGLPYVQYNSVPDGFYGLVPSSSVSDTSQVPGHDASVYSTPISPLDPLVWNFSSMSSN